MSEEAILEAITYLRESTSRVQGIINAAIDSDDLEEKTVALELASKCLDRAIELVCEIAAEYLAERIERETANVEKRPDHEH
jgi:hypothetical protein